MTRHLERLVFSLLLVPACGGTRPGSDGGTGTDTGDGIGGMDGGSTGDTADDGGDDGDDGGTSTDQTGTPTCGESQFEPTAVPPNVMLVLDKSASMVTNSWDHDGDAGTDPITRWNSLHSVVEFIVNNFNVQINFGTNLFPSEAATATYDEDACRVADTPEVPVASNNAQAILDGIPGAMATNLEGATPATAGFNTALGHLGGLDPSVERFIILVTDGAANCSADATSASELFESYDTNLPVAVGDAWSNDGIATFVVGIDIVNEESETKADGSPDGINPYVKLNEVAEAGGHPRSGDEKFYNANDEAELQTALQEIAGAVLSCTIPLDPPPDDTQQEFVEIKIDGTTWEQVSDCATEDGWVYSNLPELDEIQLCGMACDAFKTAGGQMEAIYHCPPAG